PEVFAFWVITYEAWSASAAAFVPTPVGTGAFTADRPLVDDANCFGVDVVSEHEANAIQPKAKPNIFGIAQEKRIRLSGAAGISAMQHKTGRGSVLLAFVRVQSVLAECAWFDLTPQCVQTSAIVRTILPIS
ncbi:MAG: hypothetical protein AAFO73_09895, partial [Pseudomonadota bacterium]